MPMEIQAGPAVLVAQEHVLDEQRVLDHERLVQAELLLDLLDELRRGLPAGEARRRVTGRKLEEDEVRDERDDQQDEDHPQQPSDDVAAHELLLRLLRPSFVPSLPTLVVRRGRRSPGGPVRS
jgi:hypothetical protein